MFLFTRTHQYYSKASRDEVKTRLVGEHVIIHNMDFEVMENDQTISIIPHAEQENNIKTLPITYVDFKNEGNKTKVVIKSEMRAFDLGGPQLILLFSTFLFATSFILLYVGGEKIITYTLLSVGTVIITLFAIRLQMGYFDYIRKIRAYVKAKSEGVAVAGESKMAHA